MNRYLIKPQLPTGPVTDIAMGTCYIAEYGAKLESLGIRIIGIDGPEALDHRLRGHADLLLLHIGGDQFWAAAEISLHNIIQIYNYVDLSENDAALNICAFGQFWIGDPSKASWQPTDRIKIAVRQRYARCSTCIVDEHSIITADRGIAKAAICSGIDVLEITPGHILLDGFNYGFIGGATFKLSPNKLAFTGSLDNHPDAERIHSFLESRCIDAVSLSEGPLRDIGSAVLLRENFASPLP